MLPKFTIAVLFCFLHVQTAYAAEPKLMLWAWERNEDLRFIDTSGVGVAFLAKRIFLDSEKTAEVPRFQPLYVSSATYLMAVVRVEQPQRGKPSLSEGQAESVAAGVLRAARLPGVKAVQIDYDAPLSQRDFYRGIIHRVKKGLPQGTFFSITALVSWCGRGSWLHGLPVDEAVPMFFRMGKAADAIRRDVLRGRRQEEALCAKSAGFSLDEPFLPVGRDATLYVFSPKRWTRAEYAAAKER